MATDYGAAYLVACEMYGWKPNPKGYQCYVQQVSKGYRKPDGTWRKGGHHVNNEDLQTVR